MAQQITSHNLTLTVRYVIDQSQQIIAREIYDSHWIVIFTDN